MGRFLGHTLPHLSRGRGGCESGFSGLQLCPALEKLQFPVRSLPSFVSCAFPYSLVCFPASPCDNGAVGGLKFSRALLGDCDYQYARGEAPWALLPGQANTATLVLHATSSLERKCGEVTGTIVPNIPDVGRPVPNVPPS